MTELQATCYLSKRATVCFEFDSWLPSAKPYRWAMTHCSTSTKTSRASSMWLISMCARRCSTSTRLNPHIEVKTIHTHCFGWLCERNCSARRGVEERTTVIFLKEFRSQAIAVPLLATDGVNSTRRRAHLSHAHRLFSRRVHVAQDCGCGLCVS